MTNSDYISRYINKIINLIIGSDRCVFFINPKESDYYDVEDVLLGGELEHEEGNKIIRETLQPYIYDYCLTVGTTTDIKTMVCVDATIDSIADNIFSNFTLHIYVFAPKSSNRFSKWSAPTKQQVNKFGYVGNRVNCLCSAIEEIICGRNDFGIGKVSPSVRNPNQIYIPHNDYYGRHLTFSVSNLSEVDICGY